MISRFIVLGPLGAGGMGLVLSAYDPSLDRKVAIKLLRPDLHADHLAPQRKARLLREAQAMARITHPNVLAVFEVGVFDDQVFIAMEHVDGEPLGAWLATARPWRQVLDMFLRAGRGLEAAHALGLVHRDFKPDNVLLGNGGRVLVTDFGVATFASVAADEIDDVPAASRAPVTRAGTVVGTPGYMAPEQEAGGAVDARADQFAFCVALRRALAGSMPRWMRPLVLRGLAHDPGGRFPSMGALLAALERGPLVTPLRLAVIGAIVAVGAAALALVPEREPACQGLGGKLAGVWDEEARERTRRSFLASGHPDGAELHARVAGALDDYTRSWVAMRTDACLATAVRREQSPALLDLRMRCLDRRLGAVAARVNVLGTEADRLAVARAPRSIAELEPLAGCADAELLSAAVPPPSDPQRRAWVDAAHARLDHAEALGAAGKRKEAYGVVHLVGEETRAARHAPLTARALNLLARYQREHGQPDVTAVLEEAIAAAAEAHDDHHLVDGIGRTMHALAETSRIEEALALRPALLAAVERAVHPDALRAGAHHALGKVYTRSGDYGSAVRELERALELSGQATHDDEIAVIFALAEALNEADRNGEARAILRRGMTAVERRLGPDNQQAAGLHHELGTAALHLAEYEEALESYQLVLAITEKTYGPMSHKLIGPTANIGRALVEMERYDAALPMLRRSLAIIDAAYGADNPAAVLTLIAIGDVHLGKGDLAEARALYDRALAISEEHLPEHPQTAYVLIGVGDIFMAERRPLEALRSYQRSRAIREKKLGPDHPMTFEIQGKVAGALLTLRRNAEALELIERAWAAERQKPSESEGMRADLDWTLARALEARRRDPARARALAREARELFAKVHAPGKILAEIDDWLARRE